LHACFDSVHVDSKFGFRLSSNCATSIDLIETLDIFEKKRIAGNVWLNPSKLMGKRALVLRRQTSAVALAPLPRACSSTLEHAYGLIRVEMAFLFTLVILALLWADIECKIHATTWTQTKKCKNILIMLPLQC
jgi:hypothetical protein